MDNAGVKILPILWVKIILFLIFNESPFKRERHGTIRLATLYEVYSSILRSYTESEYSFDMPYIFVTLGMLFTKWERCAARQVTYVSEEPVT